MENIHEYMEEDTVYFFKKAKNKNYYHFKAYYGSMFNELKDVKNKLYDLQINYQKFFDLCTDEEKKKLDNMIKEKGEN